MNLVVKRVLYYLFLIGLFLPSAGYLLISFGLFAGNNVVYDIPIILMFLTFALALADALWSRSPTDRFGFFEIEQDRHVFWFQLNTLFLALSLIDVLLITVAIGADIRVLALQPESTGLDLPYAIGIFAFMYPLSLILRNTLANLLGQGYGRLIGTDTTRLAGTSVIGVASFADLASVLLEKRPRLGISRLRDALSQLDAILRMKGVRLPAISEGIAKVGFVSSFNMDIPVSELTTLAEKFTRLSKRIESPSVFAELGQAITDFSKQTKWPESLVVESRANTSLYDSIGAVGTVVSAVAAFLSLALYFLVPPGTFQLGQIAVMVEGIVAALLVVVLAGFLSYRPLSRLDQTFISWYEWNVFRDARLVPSKSPKAAVVISLIAGTIVTLSGLLVSLIEFELSIPVAGLGLAYGLLGTLWGVLIIVGGLMIRRNPSRHRTWGMVIIVCSILSIFGALGGFLIGFFTGLIGGGLAISWRPPKDE